MSEIEVFFEDIPSFKFNIEFAKEQIIKLIKEEKKTAGSISIIFCSDEYLLEMNRTHLNHDYYTDIITFNYVENGIIAGDLFLSIDRIRENAKKFDVSFFEELYRVILHGILHLVGFNDKTAEEKKEMRRKENQYLQRINFRSEI